MRLQSVEPLRRQQTCANSHEVEERLQKCKPAAVTLGCGLGNVEWIIVETDSVSFCLLFQGGFRFYIKSGKWPLLKPADKEFFPLTE